MIPVPLSYTERVFSGGADISVDPEGEISVYVGAQGSVVFVFFASGEFASDLILPEFTQPFAVDLKSIISRAIFDIDGDIVIESEELLTVSLGEYVSSAVFAQPVAKAILSEYQSSATLDLPDYDPRLVENADSFISSQSLSPHLIEAGTHVRT